VRFSSEELRKLALPALAFLAFAAAGTGLIWSAGQSAERAQREVTVAQEERRQSAERLARIAEEEREVKEKLDVYRRLAQLRILGDEQRLEWADTITRIRTQRELLDMRYRVEKQRLLTSLPAKAGSVDFHASTMKLDLLLLHEDDLLRFLADLRASGNAFYSVQRCLVTRTGQAATGTGLTPRLRAECDIDLITILDRGAKR